MLNVNISEMVRASVEMIDMAFKYFSVSNRMASLPHQ